MVDLIIILAVLTIVGGAAWYVRRAKKKGKKCIGCPGNCSDCSCGK